MNLPAKKTVLHIVLRLIKILSVTIGALVLAFLGYASFLRYEQKISMAKAEVAQAALEARYQADTDGGKTPKETLELFIAALEKEDFELASRYFVLTKQEEWREKLAKGKEKNNLPWFVDELKIINKKLVNRDPTNELNGSKDFGVSNEMLVTFIKYPQGVWKIKEI